MKLGKLVTSNCDFNLPWWRYALYRVPCSFVSPFQCTREVMPFSLIVSTAVVVDFQDPHSIAVLLQKDLVVVDLTTQG